MIEQLKKEAILAAVIRHDEIAYTSIAQQFGVSHMTVIAIAKSAGIKRQRGSSSPAFRRSIAEGEK
jgi:hypothetical protein